MLGVCYYPEQWPEELWADDARRMAEMGLNYVRIGEFAWSVIEPEPDRFDWGWLDRAVETLGKTGLKVVMGTPTATPPKWLTDRHPDILPHDRHGRVLAYLVPRLQGRLAAEIPEPGEQPRRAGGRDVDGLLLQPDPAGAGLGHCRILLCAGDFQRDRKSVV